MSKPLTGPSGIRQIAEAIGVSIGTVDRALHARSGISPKTRDRVLKMAEKLNYTPNVAARNLRLNRRLRIGVFLPEQIASFFDPLRQGIRDAAETWSESAVELVFHSYPRLGEGDIEALETGNLKQYDGLVMAPGDPSRLIAFTRQKPINIPVVYVATDAPRTNRLASVAVDATISGSIAADLLGRVLPLAAPVAVFTGDLRFQDHADKLRGFAASLATLSPHLSLLPAVESHERAEDAYQSALKVLQKDTKVAGVYINTANSLPVLRAAEKVGVLGRLQIIATDLFPELIPMIEEGQVLATLYQRPSTQGKMAFEMLCRSITTGTAPPLTTRLAPHIVLRSNLSLFADRVAREEFMSSGS